METLVKDIRYALRGFAKRPAFTAVVVLTLGIGIGSNAAIFSVANAVLFQPLPFGNPEELVLVWNRLPNANVERALVSGPDFLDYRNETTQFAGFAGAFALSGAITGEGRAEDITMGWTSENLFEILQVKPVVGRDFVLEDAAPMDPKIFSDPNAVIPPGALIMSYGLWQRRFGSDPGVLGRTILLDGLPSEVVGVLPRDFRIYLPPDAGMPTDIDVWRVIPSNFAENARDAQWLTVVSRLKPGVTPEQAQHEMDALAARLREQHQHHANANTQIVVNSMHEDIVEHARPVLLALLVAVAFVLLIACANVANVLLIRATSRQREIAVRAALGGSRGRLIRQMMTESAVLATFGAAFGLLLAWWGGQLLVVMKPANLPRVENVGLDGLVVLYTVGATVLAVFLFGLAPAFRAASSALADVLKERGSESGGVRGNKVRTALVISEVALSLVLLIGAGLMFQSLKQLRNVDPGFDSEDVLTFTISVPFFKYSDFGVRANIVNELRRRFTEIPGMTAVGAVTPLPFAGGEQYAVGSYGPRGVSEEDWNANKADYRMVVPGYTDVMKIRLIGGRRLIPSDNEPDALDVGVIDEKLAARVWPGQDPMGKEILLSWFNPEAFAMERRPVLVVGIVEHVRATTLTADGREAIYLPYKFQPFLPLSVTVRAAGDPLGLVPLIRREVEAMDPDIPVSDVRMMTGYLSDAMAQTRFIFTLVSVFAGLALTLAAIGLYGVISYSVRQRTREIGVRMALGAHESSVVRLVLGHGLVLSLSGVGLGLLAAFFATRTVSSFLYGVGAADPLTYTGIAVFLVGVTALASYVPARRAVRVDPVVALRGE
ncbi:MAG: ABC transporter permease [Gemmatimonadota bacterium]